MGRKEVRAEVEGLLWRRLDLAADSEASAVEGILAPLGAIRRPELGNVLLEPQHRGPNTGSGRTFWRAHLITG